VAVQAVVGAARVDGVGDPVRVGRGDGGDLELEPEVGAVLGAPCALQLTCGESRWFTASRAARGDRRFAESFLAALEAAAGQALDEQRRGGSVSWMRTQEDRRRATLHTSGEVGS
jgi:hypothetical protein